MKCADVLTGAVKKNCHVHYRCSPSVVEGVRHFGGKTEPWGNPVSDVPLRYLVLQKLL